MEDAAYWLLIIVSATLTVFLILLSVALVYVIKFFKRANEVAESVESAAEAFRRSAQAMPWVKLFNNVFNRSRGKKG